MMLNKQQQSAVMLAHETYWESYLKGDVKSLSSLLDEGYSQIGSVENEVFFNKKDAVNFVETTIGQVAGKVEMRNRITKLEPVEEFILITEQCDLYVFIEGEWNFYSKFRASSMMQAKEGAWKMIHQHSSIPDSKAQEGENIATQKIAAENLQLREAVKRRTVELEQKNRELEIETSLERVRSVAMGMKHPADMLDVCRIIAAQLKLLHVTQIRNIQTAIFYESRDIYLNYEYFSIADKTVITEVEYNLQADVKEFVNKMQQDDKAFFTVSFEGTRLKEWMDYQEKANQYIDPNLHNSALLNYYFYSIGPGALGISTYLPLKEEQLLVFKRFRNVFELAYCRFDDIEKATAQAREAQIELALERVRAKTMAMQKSEELKEVIQVVYDQFIELNIKIEHTGFVLDYKARNDYDIWIADQLEVPAHVTIPYFDCVYYNRFNEAKNNSGDFFVTNLNFKEKNKFYKKLIEYIPGLPEETKEFLFSVPGLAISTVLLDNVCLYIENFEGIPYSGEENDVLMRFGNVFQQTYTRFLDLQKAEAQAREAQIQLALERVRARTMAMQKSDELPEAANLLFLQVLALGMPAWSAGYCTWDDDKKSSITLSMSSEGVLQPKLSMPLTEDPALMHFRETWERGESFFVEELGGEELKRHYTYLRTLPGVKETLDDIEKAGFPLPTFQIFHLAYFTKGFLLFITYEPVPGAHDIFKRFASVFEQTYTRFLDLQKAEAQAREAEIELALERVRARTMAMQHSDELQDAAILLFDQMKGLGVHTGSCGFTIWNKKEKTATVWMSSPEGGLQTAFELPHTETAVYLQVYEAMNKGEDFLVKEVAGNHLKKHFDYLSTLPGIGDVIKTLRKSNYQFPETIVFHFAFFAQGYLSIHLHEHHPETHELLKRIAKVFEQTYTRFLDLQKAEAQAREAHIEAALERVRSRSMAMYKSDELLEAGEILFSEMKKLGIESLTSGYVLLDEEGKNGSNYAPNPLTKKILPLPVIIPHKETIHLQQVVENWKKGNPFFVIEMDETETIKHQTFIAERSTNFPLNAAQLIDISPAKLFLYNFYFKEGYLLIVGGNRLSVESTDIMLRFTKVFQQTYTRFLDLQKAEAQAREAKIEAALERVRSKTMAMQHSEELQNAALLLFKQVETLGLPPFACGFNIWDEDRQAATAWMGGVGGLQPPFKTDSSQDIYLPILEAAQRGESLFVIEQRGKELEIHYEYLASIPTFRDVIIPNMVKLGIALPSYQIIHCAFFSKGYLMFISYEPVPDYFEIFKRFARVFEQTYTRFLDLQKAEAQAFRAEHDLIEIKAARRKAEDALAELKVTQKQLIQSEKMASLGELTAGIAHEIQNPLNFVNNFSEVNQELLVEMKEELEKGNLGDVKQIADDVIANEQKINHHGKRADAIVKGMLQHSSSGSGKKEPTNINALADEYLRLAYHGLRAKDKSFNATIKTDFDESIANINIIPQDIGRVLLNLINNAFYAAPLPPEGGFPDPNYLHNPTVWVSTKKMGDKVLIIVKDNGPGISQKFLDKIFQPFFTTKPTGQGTGLGLSLSYDIVKAHGGELKVETIVGEGTKFKILLPV